MDLGLAWSATGRMGASAVVLAANGAGRANAARAVERSCARLCVRGVVSTGFCGALDPALELGQVVVADRVLTLDPLADFAARLPGRRCASHGAILTVDHVVQTAGEKQRLRSTGAVAVEMEAAGVAVEARKRDLPFFCVRVVSDRAGESFRIDYNRARLADGRFSIGRIVSQAGLSPARWKELLEWRRRALGAAATLAEFLGSLEFEA